MSGFILVLFILLSSVAVFVLGMINVIKSKENISKLLFSYCSVVLSAIFFYRGLFSIFEFIHTGKVYYALIDGGDIILFTTASSFLSIIPFISLLSDKRVPYKVMISLIPVFTGIVMLVVINLFFTETPLPPLDTLKGNLSLIKYNASHPDVIFRLILLLFSLIAPLSIIISTFYFNIVLKKRHLTHFYTLSYTLMLVICILFIGSSFGIRWMLHSFYLIFSLFLILFSSLLLHNDTLVTIFLTHSSEYPSVSLHDNKEQEEIKTHAGLWERFEKMLKTNYRFTEPGIRLQEIAEDMKVNKVLIISIIHFRGFNSFNEYVNILRLERFKELAAENNNYSITELYEMAGFPSKTTFYRFFQAMEGCSPSLYLSKLNDT